MCIILFLFQECWYGDGVSRYMFFLCVSVAYLFLDHFILYLMLKLYVLRALGLKSEPPSFSGSLCPSALKFLFQGLVGLSPIPMTPNNDNNTVMKT